MNQHILNFTKIYLACQSQYFKYYWPDKWTLISSNKYSPILIDSANKSPVDIIQKYYWRQINQSLDPYYQNLIGMKR